MTQNTTRGIAEQFLSMLKGRRKAGEAVSLVGHWQMKVTRADGSVEEHEAFNTMTSSGIALLANMAVVNGNSAWLYLGVGTLAAASSLGSNVGSAGEVFRKAASIHTNSLEYAILVCTMAGAADGLTSLDLRTGFAINHPNSGFGIPANFVNSVATILGDSDFLQLQMNIRVGSQ